MKIDHFKNFIVLVTGILRDTQGRILLIKRSENNKTFRGFWQLPEGKIEFGEQPMETLSRELKEELSCRLVEACPVIARSSIVDFQGISYHLLRIVFDTRWAGTPALSEEHEAFQWFNIQRAIKIPHLVNGTKGVLLSLKQFKGEKRRNGCDRD